MSRFVLTTLLVVAAGVGAAHAQSMSDFERSRYSPAAYYVFSEPGDLTITANVWGTVRNPGLYEVPEGTHMSTLFSVAGGPAVTRRYRSDRQTVVVRLSRATPSGPEVIFEQQMEDDLFAPQEDPVLQTGDILTVETVVSQRFTWRDVFPIVAAVGSVALAIERLARSN